jgi:ribosome-binding protein aMBF1 (putative translation factor)
MTTRKPRPASDGLEILYRRYIAGRPEAEAALEAARLGSRIAQEIHYLRTAAGLTQRQLAARVGTSHSVISRLEAADYEGHSLRLLHRICAALDRRLDVRFLPAVSRRRKSA